jgi:hypothetical protein
MMVVDDDGVTGVSGPSTHRRRLHGENKMITLMPEKGNASAVIGALTPSFRRASSTSQRCNRLPQSRQRKSVAERCRIEQKVQASRRGFEVLSIITGSAAEASRIVGTAPHLPVWRDLPVSIKINLAVGKIVEKGDAWAFTLNIPDNVLDRAEAGKITLNPWTGRIFDDLRRAVYKPAGETLDYVFAIERRHAGKRQTCLGQPGRQRFDLHGVMRLPPGVVEEVIERLKTTFDLVRQAKPGRMVDKLAWQRGEGFRIEQRRNPGILLIHRETGVSIFLEPVFRVDGWAGYIAKDIDRVARDHADVAGRHPEGFSRQLRGVMEEEWNIFRGISRDDEKDLANAEIPALEAP